METKNAAAETLHKKKNISKGKIKKTIKNTLSRPDPVFWPKITDEQSKLLERALVKHKVEIPEFKKPHWKELKSIPKDQRPKQPKIQKVEGLIFGIGQCTESINNKECSAMIIETTVNPRAIVQPLIEASITHKVPVVCMEGLRNITSQNFGIPTSSLGIKVGFLQEISSLVADLTKSHKVPLPVKEKSSDEKLKIELCESKMEVDENTKESSKPSTPFNYLYRTSKSSRAFNPSQEGPKPKKAFIGQDFIEFTDKKPEENPIDSKAYMTMILKRITNNQNRTKKNKHFIIR